MGEPLSRVGIGLEEKGIRESLEDEIRKSYAEQNKNQLGNLEFGERLSRGREGYQEQDEREELEKRWNELRKRSEAEQKVKDKEFRDRVKSRNSRLNFELGLEDLSEDQDLEHAAISRNELDERLRLEDEFPRSLESSREEQERGSIYKSREAEWRDIQQRLEEDRERTKSRERENIATRRGLQEDETSQRAITSDQYAREAEQMNRYFKDDMKRYGEEQDLARSREDYQRSLVEGSRASELEDLIKRGQRERLQLEQQQDERLIGSELEAGNRNLLESDEAGSRQASMAAFRNRAAQIAEKNLRDAGDEREAMYRQELAERTNIMGGLVGGEFAIRRAERERNLERLNLEGETDLARDQEQREELAERADLVGEYLDDRRRIRENQRRRNLASDEINQRRQAYNEAVSSQGGIERDFLEGQSDVDRNVLYRQELAQRSNIFNKFLDDKSRVRFIERVNAQPGEESRGRVGLRDSEFNERLNLENQFASGAESATRKTAERQGFQNEESAGRNLTQSSERVDRNTLLENFTDRFSDIRKRDEARRLGIERNMNEESRNRKINYAFENENREEIEDEFRKGRTAAQSEFEKRLALEDEMRTAKEDEETQIRGSIDQSELDERLNIGDEISRSLGSMRTAKEDEEAQIRELRYGLEGDIRREIEDERRRVVADQSRLEEEEREYQSRQKREILQNDEDTERSRLEKEFGTGLETMRKNRLENEQLDTDILSEPSTKIDEQETDRRLQEPEEAEDQQEVSEAAQQATIETVKATAKAIRDTEIKNAIMEIGKLRGVNEYIKYTKNLETEYKNIEKSFDRERKEYMKKFPTDDSGQTNQAQNRAKEGLISKYQNLLDIFRSKALKIRDSLRQEKPNLSKEKGRFSSSPYELAEKYENKATDLYNAAFNSRKQVENRIRSAHELSTR